MHGRPRKAAKPEDEEASLAKAQKLRALQSQFLSNHHTRKWVRKTLCLFDFLSPILAIQTPSLFISFFLSDLILSETGSVSPRRLWMWARSCSRSIPSPTRHGIIGSSRYSTTSPSRTRILTRSNPFSTMSSEWYGYKFPDFFLLSCLFREKM